MPAKRTTGSIEWVGKLDDPRPTDHWRCRVTINGAREWRPLSREITLAQRSKAVRAALKLAAAARAGLLESTARPAAAADPGALTLSAWAETWFTSRTARGLKSARADKGRWKTWVAPRLGQLPVATLTAADVEGWVEWIDAQVQAKRLSWKTAHNTWGLLSRAMHEASKGKVKALRCRPDNPCRDVEPPERGAKKSKPYLYPDELLQLVAFEGIPLDERRAYAVTVYLYPRAGEVEALYWEDVDLEHGSVLVHRAVDPDTGEIRGTKGKATRRLEIERELLPLLQAMRAERPDAAMLFDPWPLHHYRARQLRANLKRAGVARAELFAGDATRKQVTFHDLRATGTTWAAIRGDEPLKIMHRAGHKDLATTMGYVREAENLRAGFGVVFPPLPASLIDPPAAQRTSRGTSQGAGPRAKTTAKQARYRFGVRDSNPAEGVRHPPASPETPSTAPRTPPPVGGPEAVPTSHGTIPGTLRAALAAAVAGGDWTTADGLLQLLRSADRPPAEVVDLAARRRG